MTTTEGRKALSRPLLSREARRRLLRLAYHAVGLFPLAWLVFDFWFGFLGPEPIRAMILRTGKAAIIMLTLSLACTPIGYIFRWKEATLVRRPLGLYAFMYVCCHFLIFVWLDYALILPLIVEEIVVRRYALVGFAAFLLLIPLALTSTTAMIRRLGRRWGLLHRLVYPATGLALLHYLMVQKLDWRVGTWYVAAFTVLMLLRLVRRPAPGRPVAAG